MGTACQQVRQLVPCIWQALGIQLNVSTLRRAQLAFHSVLSASSFATELFVAAVDELALLQAVLAVARRLPNSAPLLLYLTHLLCQIGSPDYRITFA